MEAPEDQVQESQPDADAYAGEAEPAAEPTVDEAEAAAPE